MGHTAHIVQRKVSRQMKGMYIIATGKELICTYAHASQNTQQGHLHRRQKTDVAYDK